MRFKRKSYVIYMIVAFIYVGKNHVVNISYKYDNFMIYLMMNIYLMNIFLVNQDKKLGSVLLQRT